MTGQKKQAVLKRFYFRNFTIMVVIPLLVVFIGAFSVVSYLIRQTAVETIDAADVEHTAQLLAAYVKEVGVHD